MSICRRLEMLHHLYTVYIITMLIPGRGAAAEAEGAGGAGEEGGEKNGG